MTAETRVVMDTGVVVSAALLPKSVPRKAFEVAMARGRLLVSADTIAEIDEVFRRAKFNKYVSERLRLEFLSAMLREAELVEVSHIVSECRDPKDDAFLNLALSGRATHLVSGDADLLVLNPFRAIPILTPQGFLKLWDPSNVDSHD